MSEIRLSIIIPFYNVERYIAQCLQSVYNQDVSEADYEVICVNDCSPDNSREIVLNFQKTHKNLKLIEHESNRKLGAARNTGLWAATGKYILFLDSDDYIAENCLKKLLETAENSNAQILQFNAERFSDDGKMFHNHKFAKQEPELISGTDYIKNTPFNAISLETCFRLFDRELMLEKKIFFEEGVYYEDMIYTLAATLAADRIKIVADFAYFYRINDNSIVNALAKRGNVFADFAGGAVGCMKFILKNNYTEICRSAMEFRAAELTFVEEEYFWFLTDKERENYFNHLKINDIKGLKKYLPKKIFYFYNYPKMVRLFSFILKKRLARRIMKKLLPIKNDYHKILGF
ncbi:hypothetical protein FACS1894180_5230 [Bacteroidia bacterium]|nr:hypothetical protein FACS1894180_5230 [Bacteroidia bacterium]